jgi:hypothetical protein
MLQNIFILMSHDYFDVASSFWFYKSGEYFLQKKKEVQIVFWIIFFSKYPKYYTWPTSHNLNIWNSDNLKYKILPPKKNTLL